ncbi:MAG: hypothetical protein LAT75_06210 [Candidatus Cyclonatronum sp.]|uniref:hypothetical protein n=1 Tax=Cyclonatronum sp. TaxID=3024185 RepID=UPI0025C52A1A|nr:hypothetical protein [Cyclonatronum sp.]MCH8486441.1 hypothetical protein [Cyclonatronum sp.]
MKNMNFRAFILVLTLLSATLILNACSDNRPGEPPTSDVQQFLGEGFAFKYPTSGRLDLQGQSADFRRRLSITGPDVRLYMPQTGGEISLPAFAFEVTVFDNPGRLDGRAFARERILSGWRKARDAGEPAGFWPVDPATNEVDSRNIRIHGREALEVAHFAGDAMLVCRYTASGAVALSVCYRDMPPENNPFTESWRAVWLQASDSIRLN